MSHDKIGPKEAQLRALKAEKFAGRRAASKPPSTSDLRKKVAAIKPMTRYGGKRGR